MDKLFEEAQHKRRTTEYVLTSRMTNAVWYGSPAWAKKRSIWPPLIDGPVLDRQLPVQPGGGTFSAKSLPKPPIPGTASARTEDIEVLTGDTSVLYHKLHSGSVIRILEIQPGNYDDKIICKFHYIDLASASHMEYEALSYVWGKPRHRYRKPGDVQKVETECNGHPLGISKNLEEALRHIRQPSTCTFLWVDAMCINQDDVRERGHQVTLMTSIYRQAKRVVIWLGEASGSSYFWNSRPEIEDVRAQRAFGAICEVVNRWQGAESASYTFTNPVNLAEKVRISRFEEYPSVINMVENPGAVRQAMEQSDLARPKPKPSLSMFSSYYPYATGQPSHEPEPEPVDNGLDSDESTAADSLIWKALSNLFSCSWFWRVWVIQEAILARSAIVKWAHAEIDWKWTGLASAILRTSYHKICERLRMSGVYNAYFMYRLSPALCDLPPPQLSFVQLLRLTRQFEVTDNRDRVYGLLGIQTTDGDPARGEFFLQPDYEISEQELWKRLAVKVISVTEDLSLLSSVQYTTDALEGGTFPADRFFDGNNEGAVKYDLPSWVPLWDVVYRATLAPWDLSDRFAASKGMPLRLSSVVGADNLVVEGIQIGVVGKCCPYMWHDADTSLLQSSSTLGKFFSSDKGLRLLARTLTAGRDWYGSLSSETEGESSLKDLAAHLLECHDNYNKRRWNGLTPRGLDDEVDWRPETTYNHRRAFDAHPHLETRLRELASIGGDAARFRETAIPVCERRRMFLTLNGFLGLGPDCVLEGDILCVLSGADLSFVLRPSSSKVGGSNEKEISGNKDDGHYTLVGECYVEGLMQGEGMSGSTGNITGPVPPELIAQDIITEANEPEKVISQGLVSEIIRTTQKHARLEAGNVFTPAMVEALRQNETGKKWFDIR